MEQTTEQSHALDLLNTMFEQTGTEVVESATLAWNETYGWTVYLTARNGRFYQEIGIKPNGDIFNVR